MYDHQNITCWRYREKPHLDGFDSITKVDSQMKLSIDIVGGPQTGGSFEVTKGEVLKNQ